MSDFEELSEDSRRIFEARTLLVSVLGFLVILVVLSRLMYLQVFSHEEYRTKSQNNRIQIQTILPPRGEIHDRNGVLLADNNTILSLELIPEQIQDIDETFLQLRQHINIAQEDIESYKARSSNRLGHDGIVLKRNVSIKEQAALALIRHELTGVRLATEVVRHYPHGEKFVHALGAIRRITVEDLKELDQSQYAGMQFVGGTGIEKFYEEALRGERGHRTVEVDATGRVIAEIEEQREPPLQGANITTHLDYNIQIAAHEALGEQVGAIVAIEPDTGGILALVSTPSYDPNESVLGWSSQRKKEIYGDPFKPLFNRAVQGLYAPGSTFKPVIGLTALYREQADWEEVIQDDGVFSLPNSSLKYRSWNRTATNPGGHGSVDMHRAIYRSANVYFYTMASRLDVDGIAEFASNRLGLGRAPAYDLPEQSVGVLPSRSWKRSTVGEPWNPGDTIVLGIGQGYLTVSPLQLATVAATLANRGTWIQPRLLKSSNMRLAGVESEPQPARTLEGSGEVVAHWEKMATAMSAVVHRGAKGYDQNGTAWAYIGMDIPYVMAGKSGTSQVVMSPRDGTEVNEEELERFERNHALFIAFAPLERPTIAVAVVVEHGGGGSSVAAPLARAVIDAHLVPDLVASNE